jgi:site-specific recombinase XerD
MTSVTVGSLVYRFFLEYLAGQKGLRPTSIRSYRDTIRLFLVFVAEDARRPISQLRVEDLSFEHVLGFLQHLEAVRHSAIATRNQRLAALRSFFDFVGRQVPEMLRVCERVAAIPTKRTPMPEMRFMDREEISTLFAGLPNDHRLALRDRALLLVLYNTGARVQKVADLRVEHVILTAPPHVRLHGKGDKWRTCPLWKETVHVLRQLFDGPQGTNPTAPVFASVTGRPLTRFGIYKRVRHHAGCIESTDKSSAGRRITPHAFRHTTAVHLLEAGVEVNVIRGWLGHVSLETTNRYAEITAKMKEAALKLCEPPVAATALPRKRTWQDDGELLTWLASL